MKRFASLVPLVSLAVVFLAAAAAGQTAWDQPKVAELASSLSESLASLETIVNADPDLGMEGVDGGGGALFTKVTTMHEEAMGLSDALGKGEGRDATKNRVGNLGEQFDDLNEMADQMMNQGDFGAGLANVSQIFEQLKAYYGKI